MGNLPFGPNRCPNMESKSHAAPVSPDYLGLPQRALEGLPKRDSVFRANACRLNVLIVPIIVLQQFAVSAFPIN